MLLQQVDAVARLLERRRRDIGRQRVGIDEGLHAQPLAASVRLQDEAPLAEGLARRLDEAALAGDHDGARDGDTRAGQRAVLAHLADLEIERAGAVHHPPPVLREPRQRRRRKLRRETVAAGVRRGAHAVVEYRSEEHTSELQSLMRISYAVFCLKKKNT